MHIRNAAFLTLFACLMPALAQDPRPDPAHTGPLAPDPRIKQHNRQPQTKLADIAGTESRKSVPKDFVGRELISGDIPGVILRDAGDHVEIYNGSDSRIIGLQVTIDPLAHFVIDGLDSFFAGIGPGEAMALGNSGAGDIVLPPDYSPESSGKKQKYSIDWVIFQDGRFFGTEIDGSNLSLKARVRREFAEAVGRKLPTARNAFVDAVMECTDDPKCMDRDKLGSAKTAYEVTALRRVAESYKRSADRFQDKTDQFLKDFTASHAAYPRIKRIAAASRIFPQSKSDGWALALFRASCKNTPGHFIGSSASTCTYTNSGFGDDPAPNGFLSSAFATCVNNYTLTNGIALRTKFDHATLHAQTEPNAIRFEPRHRVRTRIETNYGQQLREGWIGDTIYFGVAYGYPEKFGIHSDDNGGHTWCALYFDGPNFGTYANNTVDGYPRPNNALAAAILIDYNTLQQAIPNGYGFFIANYDEALTCGDPIPFISPFETAVYSPGTIWGNSLPTIKNAGQHGLGVPIGCFHESQTANNGQGTCNPTQNFCCCMATYNDFGLCTETYGLVPDPIGCGDPAIAFNTPSNGSSMITGVTTQSSALPKSMIGVARAGGSWLLDALGQNTYVSGETLYVPSFIPPGGVQAGDVPVAGDWRGLGQTMIGYYRNGTWYLDGNGNGVWDGVAGGDLQYQFGGGVAPFGQPNTSGYVPGDVPVVGDWQGGGKDCVGVFRYGYFWIIDSNCSGTYETGDNAFSFGGILGDTPVVGKWGGFSNSQVGVVRCYIDPSTNVCAGPPYYWIYDAGTPMTAWHGVGQGMGCGLPNPSTLAQCRTPAPFALGGLPGDRYVAGDWVGIGASYPGLYRNGQWVLDIDGTQQHLATYWFGGSSGDVPIVGKW